MKYDSITIAGLGGGGGSQNMTVDDNKGYIDKTQNHYDVIYVQPLTAWQSFMIYITQWD